MQTITVNRKITINYSGMTLERFVEEANRLLYQQFGEELDSMDGGDATGAIMRLLALEDDGQFVWTNELCTMSIIAKYQDDLFQWEPPLG